MTDYLFNEDCKLCEWLKQGYEESQRKARDSDQLVFGLRVDIYSTHRLQHSIDELAHQIALLVLKS